MKSNENEINQIYAYLKADDVNALERLIAEKPDLKNLKIGPLPIVSVAVLFHAQKCVEFLTPVFGEVNAYIEGEDVEEVSKKLQELFERFSNEERKSQEGEPLENKIGEGFAFEIYADARFIEPSEIAFLLGEEELANQILEKVGVKTFSARRRLESLFEETKTYAFSGKGDKPRIVNKEKNAKKPHGSKRKMIIVVALALCVAILLPIIILTAMQVKVTFYVGNEIYGYERGISGRDITVKDPEKEGNTFVGWFQDPELKHFSENKLPKKSGNLYAGWTPNSYTITFDCDFLPEGFSNENTGFYGESLDFPILKMDGKLFLGWYDEEGRLATSNVFTRNVVLKPRFVDFENNSADNPFEITSAEEFLFLCNQEGYFTIKDGLVIDENFLSSGFLCDYSSGFVGVLDGLNRTLVFKGVKPLFIKIDEKGVLKNLNVSVEKDVEISEFSEVDRFGIVAVMNAGLLENVKVEFKTVVDGGAEKGITLKSLWRKNYFGAMVGSNSGKLSYCSVEGSFEMIVGAGTSGISYMGGLVGANIGRIENSLFSAKCTIQIADRGFGGIAGLNTGTIANCRSEGEIQADGNMKTTGSLVEYVAQVAGIVAVNGTSKGEDGLVKVGEIISSANYATIRVTNHNLELYAGGIGAYSESVIDSCENNGEIKVEKGENIRYIGGIVGFGASRGEGKINSSSNNGKLTLSFDGYSYVGGIVGYSIASDPDEKLEILSSVNNGDLTNGTQMGGLAGFAVYSSFVDCENNGVISSTTRSDKESTKALGGLVGGTMECRLERLINNGEVKHLKESNVKKEHYIGGLVADNVDSIITGCWNTAKLTFGENDVAGLISAVVNLMDGFAEITNTYAIFDGNTPAYYSYSSATDKDGNFVDHADGNLKKPKLYADYTGLKETFEPLNAMRFSSFSFQSIFPPKTPKVFA